MATSLLRTPYSVPYLPIRAPKAQNAWRLGSVPRTLACRRHRSRQWAWQRTTCGGCERGPKAVYAYSWIGCHARYCLLIWTMPKCHRRCAWCTRCSAVGPTNTTIIIVVIRRSHSFTYQALMQNRSDYGVLLTVLSVSVSASVRTTMQIRSVHTVGNSIRPEPGQSRTIPGGTVRLPTPIGCTATMYERGRGVKSRRYPTHAEVNCTYHYGRTYLLALIFPNSAASWVVRTRNPE